VRSSLECSPLCHSGDRGFESRRDRHIGLWLSLVERALREREVIGSNPVSPTMVLPTRADRTGRWRSAVGNRPRKPGRRQRRGFDSFIFLEIIFLEIISR
jgi:hypothetical protein